MSPGSVNTPERGETTLRNERDGRAWTPNYGSEARGPCWPEVLVIIVEALADFFAPSASMFIQKSPSNLLKPTLGEGDLKGIGACIRGMTWFILFFQDYDSDCRTGCVDNVLSNCNIGVDVGSNDWLFVWLIDWLIDRLIDWHTQEVREEVWSLLLWWSGTAGWGVKIDSWWVSITSCKLP